MSPTLIVIGASVSAAFVVWGVQFAKERAISSGLRLIGSVLLLVVAASHFAEKFRWLAWMGWGLPNSPGHYVDLVSAIVGVSLFSGARFVLRFGGSADILAVPAAFEFVIATADGIFLDTASPAGAHGTIQTRLCRNLKRCRKCKPPEPREAPENDRLRQSVTVFLAEVEITARRLRTSKIDRLMPIVAGNRRIRKSWKFAFEVKSANF